MSNESKDLLVKIKNFQSISDTELTFSPGITLIVGQSNSGKTAVFRAIQACLSNSSNTKKRIKWGTKGTQVEINFEGDEIVWSRTPSDITYIVNGSPFEKAGRTDAFEILGEDNIGFAQDNNGTLMNLESESQILFPYGISKSDLFRLFEDVFCVSDSSVILKSAKEVEDKTKREITSTEEELVKSENKLKELENFIEEVDLDKIQFFANKLRSSKDRLSVLRDGLPTIKLAVRFDNFDLGTLESPDTNNKLSVLREKEQCKNIITRLKCAHELGKSLVDIVYESNVDVTEFKNLKALRKDIEVLKQLSNLSFPDQTFENSQGKYKELRTLKKELSVLKLLSDLSFPEQAFENLLGTYKDLRGTKEFIVRLKKQLKSKSEEKARAEETVKDIEERLKEFKVCPLCHRELE